MVVEEKEKKPSQLELFENNLPHKPYCSDDLELGLLIRAKKQAVSRRIIQHNKPAEVRWLVFDCDYPDALGKVEFNNLPAPNLLVSNPKNGHSHLFYGLEIPVIRTDAGRADPLRYLAAIEFAMCLALEADPSYAGLVAKNPLHTHWRTTTHNPNCYELGELAEYLTIPKKLPKKAQLQGLGRNCTVFEKVRFIAYGNVLKFKVESNQKAFFEFVLAACQGVNAGFPTPLEMKEITSIAKSISKWTWKHFKSALMSAEEWQKYVRDTHIPALQKMRQQKQVESRHRATKTKREKAFELRQGGSSQRQIAEVLEVCQKTVSNWLKVAK